MKKETVTYICDDCDREFGPYDPKNDPTKDLYDLTINVLVTDCGKVIHKCYACRYPNIFRKT